MSTFDIVNGYGTYKFGHEKFSHKQSENSFQYNQCVDVNGIAREKHNAYVIPLKEIV